MRYARACSASALVVAVACGTGEQSRVVPCRSPARPDEVCIGGGAFRMGHDPLTWTRPPCPEGEICGPGNPPPTDFSPVHQVKLDPFYLDRFPASNAEYRACFEAGVCPNECGTSCGGRFYEQVHPAR